LIPSKEVFSRVGGVVPLQTTGLLLIVKVGVMVGVTVTLSVAVEAHCPLFGVKVYVPLAVLSITAGDHVPVIPFKEVVGKVGAVVPAQKAGIVLKVGIMVGVTVTLSVAVEAHCPLFGVKVYVPLEVLSITAGDHVPVIPFKEVVGKVGGVVPLQKAGIVLKVGVTVGVTVTLSVAVEAHCPLLGVKVYVPLEVLSITAGDHVPEIPFKEVVGKVGAVVPAQKAGIGVKSGTTPSPTVIVPDVVAVPQLPPAVVMVKVNGVNEASKAIPDIVSVVPEIDPKIPLGKLLMLALFAGPPN
jgi:hypothetical protein